MNENVPKRKGGRGGKRENGKENPLSVAFVLESVSLVDMIKGGMSHIANLTTHFSKRPTFTDQPLADLRTYRGTLWLLMVIVNKKTY